MSVPRLWVAYGDIRIDTTGHLQEHSLINSVIVYAEPLRRVT